LTRKKKKKNQLSQLREKLASVYEDEDDYLEAAKTLQGIPLDSGHRYVVLFMNRISLY
jgi:COP9 signalosome complex subunit 4